MKAITRILLIELETKVLRDEMKKVAHYEGHELYEALNDNFTRLADFNDEEYWEYVWEQHITNPNLDEEEFIRLNL